jgi:hypothetical protein
VIFQEFALSLSNSEVNAIAETSWFKATSSPYLLLDDRFRIRAANAAHQHATGIPPAYFLGEVVFDAFPDNPAVPDANGVARASRSFDFVFRRGTRHSMGVQRHDLPDLDRPGQFRPEFWSPISHPIKDGLTTVALLHHCENITPVLRPTADSALHQRLDELREAAVPLHQSFPTLPADEVLAVLAHSQLVVSRTLGAPDITRAQQLATLRLEVQSGAPAESPLINGHRRHSQPGGGSGHPAFRPLVSRHG